jgi:hypothetical protein
MKISQHNWNWWFVINCIIFFVIIMIGGMLPISKVERALHNLDTICTILSAIFVLSIIPCLYIGTKSSEYEEQ